MQQQTLSSKNTHLPKSLKNRKKPYPSPQSREKKDKTPETSKRKPEKVEKRWKKGLTKREESGNIIKLRKGAGARKARRDKESAEKKQKMRLEANENVEKKLEKSFENPLTNGTECDILYKLSQRAATNRYLENWTTKDEKTKQGTSKDEPKNSLNSKEVHTIWLRIVIPKEKVKERIKLEKVNSGTKYREIFYSRVWSWLRMNAGGVLNTFKSYELILKLASEES